MELESKKITRIGYRHSAGSVIDRDIIPTSAVYIYIYIPLVPLGILSPSMSLSLSLVIIREDI